MKHVIYILILFLFVKALPAQELPVPDGRSIREIVEDKYPDGNLLIGATTGSWAFSEPTGILMDREFSYVTPENDFKQQVVRNNPGAWNWSKADAWLQHIIDNDQVLRIHGPISPQCSKWVKDDSRTAEELATELDTFMTALCQRYNGVDGIKYLDVVNEISLDDGSWFGPKAGTDLWENPWFLIGQDNDPNQTPLYIKQAFSIAKQHAPDLKLIINNHCHPGTQGMEKVKETAIYLRDQGYRVDGIGWQAHLWSGWQTEENLNHLRDLIEWCKSNTLEFHITEFDAWLEEGSNDLENHANTYKAIIDVMLEFVDDQIMGWNAWHVTDASGWKVERKPSLFDDEYAPKPAYYSFQLALESMGDYTTAYQVEIEVIDELSELPVENAVVDFNGETMTTNASGLVVFTGITANRYRIDISGEGRETLSNIKYSVFSDTTFRISMNPEQFSLDVTIKDSYLMSVLRNAAVTIGSETIQTNGEGISSFLLETGDHVVSVSKVGYHPKEVPVSVNRDASLEILLDKKAADVKFKIKNGLSPVNNANVSLNGNVFLTNSLGISTFSDQELNVEYNYEISKEGFYELSGSFILKTDTTIDLQMEPSVANVSFELDIAHQDIVNGQIKIGDITEALEPGNPAVFYGLERNNSYTYFITSENYNDFENSFFLEQDTMINLSGLIPVSTNAYLSNPEFQVYPNPFLSYINIVSTVDIGTIEISSIDGKVLFTSELYTRSAIVQLSLLDSGLYFIRTRDKGQIQAILKL